MGAVAVLRDAPGKVHLLDAYRQVIADGYNHGATYNKSSVQVMIGFLAAAFVALRVVGNEEWALRFESAGKQLESDWRAYPDVVPRLCEEIDNR